MTTLTKVIRRRTRHAYSVLYAGAPRPIVVSLEPGDVICFRESGRRHRWTLAIDHAFRQAVRESAEAIRLKRKK